jgi:hypothetical protein
MPGLLNCAAGTPPDIKFLVRRVFAAQIQELAPSERQDYIAVNAGRSVRGGPIHL